MIRSLYTAASGMNAQQLQVDVLSNNLANINTPGFKRLRTDFSDLIYQTIQSGGSSLSAPSSKPLPTQVGLGSKPTATLRIMTQGALQKADNPTDCAIEGDGFFRIRQADGSEVYTRDGSFRVDEQGNMVTSSGAFVVEPRIVFPSGFVRQSLAIGQSGEITVQMPGSDMPIPVGQVRLFRFTNPAGLEGIGSNLLRETGASGPAFEGEAGSEGFGRIQQGFLEMANVNIGQELVNMIVAQRAYEFNAKAIQSSDSMLATAVNLKR